MGAGQRARRAGCALVAFLDSSSAETANLIQRRAAEPNGPVPGLAQAIADAKGAAEHDSRDVNDAKLGVELAELNTARQRASTSWTRLEAERGSHRPCVAKQKLRQLDAEVAQRAAFASVEAGIAPASARGRRGVGPGSSRLRIGAHGNSRADIGFAIYVGNRNSISAQVSGAQQPYRVGDQVPAGMNLANEYPDPVVAAD
jgi:hypothetical protein